MCRACTALQFCRSELLCSESSSLSEALFVYCSGARGVYHQPVHAHHARLSIFTAPRPETVVTTTTCEKDAALVCRPPPADKPRFAPPHSTRAIRPGARGKNSSHSGQFARSLKMTEAAGGDGNDRRGGNGTGAVYLDDGQVRSRGGLYAGVRHCLAKRTRDSA